MFTDLLTVFKLKKFEALHFDERVFEEDGKLYKAISNKKLFDYEILIPEEYKIDTFYTFKDGFCYAIRFENRDFNCRAYITKSMDLCNKEEAILNLKEIAKNCNYVDVYLDKHMKVTNVLYVYVEAYETPNGDFTNENQISLIDPDLACGIDGLLKERY